MALSSASRSGSAPGAGRLTLIWSLAGGPVVPASRAVGDRGVDAVALGGPSYGGWIAARYAIARPERVSSLVLVDPADTFSATPLGFRLRGIPLFLGRDRFRRFHQWETGGRNQMVWP